MKQIFSLILLFFIPLMADKTTILAQKGARIAKIMCDQKKLHTISVQNIDKVKSIIVSEKLCQKLNKRQLEAVATYLTTGGTVQESRIDVPKDAKCPICGMFVAKYPKWVAYIRDSRGNMLYFDGVKDMMKYYFNNKNTKFSTIMVTDFYTLHPIEAQKAYFVIGSNVYGPMGEELIPFKTREDAEVFKTEHYGKKIIRFDEIDENYLY